MATYLLPCTCGQKLPVTEGQSGAQVKCDCGREQEVPRVRELRHLRQVTATPATNWGWRQALVFAGLTASLIGFVAAFNTWRGIPTIEDLDFPQMHQVFQKLRPVQAWRDWDLSARYGLQLPLPEVQDLLRRIGESQLKLYVAGGLALAGVAVTLIGLWLPALQRRMLQPAGAKQQPPTNPGKPPRRS